MKLVRVLAAYDRKSCRQVSTVSIDIGRAGLVELLGEKPNDPFFFGVYTLSPELVRRLKKRYPAIRTNQRLHEYVFEAFDEDTYTSPTDSSRRGVVRAPDHLDADLSNWRPATSGARAATVRRKKKTGRSGRP